MLSPNGSSRVGTMFGPYELRSLIGVGGMGEVYRAYDTAKDRIVAVKLLRAEVAADPNFQERFRRESRLAARLQEPHIIPVHDWGEIGGALYIDMRLVDGTNLKGVLRRCGPLEPRRAASVIAQIASALDAAHADGLIHRDIKPENVLLTPNDFAYLVDFGIAHADGDSGLTRTGAAIGSAAYMAPERFTGGQVGPEVDVYALTCLLHECLTGRPPFPVGDLGRLMSAHVLSPPPRPSATRPGLNRAFDNVIAHGMAKQPPARFSSAGELAGAATWAAALARSPTAVDPHRIPPSSTRRFSALHPNPFPTGYTPYVAQQQLPAKPVASRGFGRGQMLVAGLAAGTLAVAALIAAFVFLRGHNSPAATIAVPPTATTTESPTTTTTEPTATPTSTTPTTTTGQPLAGLPGTDAQGFVGSFARCDPGSAPAVIAQTTKSQVVVCQTGPGTFYYRGVRLSDGASIQLTNVTRSSGGFDVANPVDGTRYQVRPNELAIVQPDCREDTEPMVQYTL